MPVQDLDDLPAHSQHRIEAGSRLLENHTHGAPPRTPRISTSVISRLSNRTLPSAISPPSGKSRMIDSAVIDFPLPDSPISAKVSPGAIATADLPTI